MKTPLFVSATLGLWLCATLALGEGSAEFDIRDATHGGQAHDQRLEPDTAFYVEVLNDTGDVATGDEKVCWTGTNNLRVYIPGDDPGSVGATYDLDPDECTPALSQIGSYPLRAQSIQARPTEWDIRVCDGDVSDNNCLNDDANERVGRLWSYNWHLDAADYISSRGVNGSVYAVVPGGDVGRDAVMEMSMDNVAGYDYLLAANSIGTETSGGVRVGRSTPTNGYNVVPEFPIYLNPPESAQYNWITPIVSNVVIAPSCGNSIVLDAGDGEIQFGSNVTGQYVVVCDADMDGVYDFASTDDFSSFGGASIGSNTVTWDGKTNGGVNVAPGDYNCVIRLNVGEFHFVAQDLETSYPGIRMYRVESDRVTRTARQMFWDDNDAPNDNSTMAGQAGQFSPISPVPDGLDPQAKATAASAFYYIGGDPSSPTGNARAWGDFDGDGKGNNSYLDTFSAADTAISPPFVITVVASDADDDGDNLLNGRECELGADPQNPDTDGDGVDDGFEADSMNAPNTDGDAFPDILDPDDDGDGIPTIDELGSENGDGDPSDAQDSDNAGDGPDYLDTDADNDGVPDGSDPDPVDGSICADVDGDGCDDCANVSTGGGDPSDDGTDTDGDGLCDDGGGLNEDLDDDNDGVLDVNDSAPLVATQCKDDDQDGCDDCSVTANDGSGGSTSNDGLDTDGDGFCNDGGGLNEDLDDDGDGVLDVGDSAPLVATQCKDDDQDGCDDCSLTGNDGSGGSTSNDGLDTDGDGFCNDGGGLNEDLDDDGDGVLDVGDSAPLVATQCKDDDQDGCDDCSLTGNDGSGGSTSNDGTDFDSDGLCDDGGGPNEDTDDDGDGVLDVDDSAPLVATECKDDDQDGCDDCSLTGNDGSGGSTSNDGTDFDSDGLCDDGGGPNEDTDDDGDGVLDVDDSAPLVATECKDDDQDGCDDCSVTADDGSGGSTSNDGTDFDGDGLCDDGGGPNEDTDDDGDGVLDVDDSAPLVATECKDDDQDGCDDCSVTADDGSGGDVANDGDDFDGDGLCDDGGGPSEDLDDDDDGVLDVDDVAPLDNTRCQDTDADGCDDCSAVHTGGGDPANDGADIDDDGICDLAAGDTDGDGLSDPEDLDADDDGIPNDQDGFGDQDGDGIANWLDLDSDGDGIPDIVEGGGAMLDGDGNGRIDNPVDDNDDGLHDPLAEPDGALPVPDTDGDALPDFLDLDADADGLSDAVESDSGDLDGDGDGRLDDATDDNGNGIADVVDPSAELPSPAAPVVPPDTDDDGAPDFQDVDADDDGLPDATEGHDQDGDGTPDLEPGGDGNGDGLDDAFVAAPGPPDHSEPGNDLPDYRDPDDEGDGIATAQELEDAETYDEYGSDVDGDGTPNYLDPDADGDGYGDGIENQGDGDLNGDDVPDYLQPWVYDEDSDEDGIPDFMERDDDGGERDSDGDGTPDHLDPDDDGDGIPTEDETGRDSDGDGDEDYLDPDDDDDGVLTIDERTDEPADQDTDADGTPDHLDTDDDGDGLSTVDERPGGQDIDTDDDGTPDYLDPDDDGDGLPTEDETGGMDGDLDSDGDGIPDHQDVDDDGDGIPTMDEVTDGDIVGNDVDGDGIPNHLDLDSDGDGTDDETEGDIDEDNDGVPDYLEPPQGSPPGLAGGALCSVGAAPGSNTGSSPNTLLWIAMATLALRRRRRTHIGN